MCAHFSVFDLSHLIIVIYLFRFAYEALWLTVYDKVLS